MPRSLQVLYPVTPETRFDHDYYLSTHMDLVAQHMGPHIQSTLVTQGYAPGPDGAAGYHAIATIVFADQAALDAALAVSGPVLEDIPKFTNATPQMLIGDVV